MPQRESHLVSSVFEDDFVLDPRRKKYVCVGLCVRVCVCVCVICLCMCVSVLAYLDEFVCFIPTATAPSNQTCEHEKESL